MMHVGTGVCASLSLSLLHPYLCSTLLGERRVGRAMFPLLRELYSLAQCKLASSNKSGDMARTDTVKNVVKRLLNLSASQPLAVSPSVGYNKYISTSSCQAIGAGCVEPHWSTDWWSSNV